ncbi:MAG: glutathione S-transferase family protein [Proteobacteria bacterium]|nr:glutathione S-transferase family protein [Pseudomonadota bacterium]
MIKIHNFPRGARGVRVMWLCEEMGLPYDVELVSFPVSDAYRAKNPLGSVPFLEDGSVAINESVAMVLYIAGKYGPTPLLPGKDDPALARVLQMTVFSEATFGGGINPLIMAKFAAPEADKQNWSVTAQEGRSQTALDFLSGTLGDAPYLAGDNFTIADICNCTALGIWQGALNKAIAENLKAYRERCAARPAYQRAQTKATGKG